MAGRVDQATQTAAIAKVTGHAAMAPAIREELQLILAGSCFSSSHRSQRFLSHVVDLALDGRFDQLKERSIGVDLFSRPAAYDTNEDSIVRVTATDVRKRLAEHYSTAGKGRVRIGLPQGSYIPEFQVSDTAQPGTRPVLAEAAPLLVPALTAAPATPTPREPLTPRVPSPAPWLAYACVLLGVLACVLGWQNVELRKAAPAAKSQAHALPWLQLFTPDRTTYLVTSDTSFAALQDLVGRRIPLAEYASRNYVPRDLDARDAQAAQLLVRNQFTSAADASIAASVAGIAAAAPGKFLVAPAKMMQIRTFRTPDNFMLLGSSYANPWVELFRNHVGLSIEYNTAHRKQICRDRHATNRQPVEYVPTALTGGNGESYAMIALLRNPGQSGHVLLVAGTNMEGTEAAADLAVDGARLAAILQKAGVDATVPAQFEILIKLSSMAGAASASEVVLARQLR
ncbi:MAG: hypothetical protein JNL98_16565 [Bryobacterales bacterium]|nr:hypothetical protein [Bryobacterales bacterium]